MMKTLEYYMNLPYRLEIIPAVMLPPILSFGDV